MPRAVPGEAEPSGAASNQRVGAFQRFSERLKLSGRSAGQEERGSPDDLAALLPVFGAILLTPVLANLFLTRTSLFGLPLDMLYIFAVWIFLIVGARWLSRRLPQIAPPDDAPPPELKGAADLPQADDGSA